MLRAVIFDFNGVIVDDEPLHLQAFQEVLAREGLKLAPADYYQRYLGLDDRGLFQAVIADQHAGPADTARVAALVQRKSAAYLAALAQGVRLFPGVQQLVRALAAGLPLAIASGALRAEIDHVLERGGIADCFSVIVSADEVSAGKPDPEGYLLAWQRLRQRPGLADLEPAQCLVLEDAPHGIAAARAAGMACVGVAQSRPADELGRADRVVASLEELDLAALRALA